MMVLVFAILIAPFVLVPNFAFGLYTDDVIGFEIEPPQNWKTSVVKDSQYGKIVVFTSNEEYKGGFAPYFYVIRIEDEDIRYSEDMFDDQESKVEFFKGFVQLGLTRDIVEQIRITKSKIEEYDDGYGFEIQGDLNFTENVKQTTANFATAGIFLKSDEIFALFFYSSPDDYFSALSDFYNSFQTFRYYERQQVVIPEWIRNNALWWSDGFIEDAEFLSGIQYLIDQEIMKIPITNPGSEAEAPFLPNWVKDTAGWWATGKVSDQDFIRSIQWLIENGIIRV